MAVCGADAGICALMMVNGYSFALRPERRMKSRIRSKRQVGGRTHLQKVGIRKIHNFQHLMICNLQYGPVRSAGSLHLLRGPTRFQVQG